MDRHLATASDRRRSRAVRATAWKLYEIEAWLEAHTDRDFPLTLVPEEYRGHVYHLLTERLAPPMLTGAQLAHQSQS